MVVCHHLLIRPHVWWFRTVSCFVSRIREPKSETYMGTQQLHNSERLLFRETHVARPTIYFDPPPPFSVPASALTPALTPHIPRTRPYARRKLSSMSLRPRSSILSSVTPAWRTRTLPILPRRPTPPMPKWGSVQAGPATKAGEVRRGAAAGAAVSGRSR